MVVQLEPERAQLVEALAAGELDAGHGASIKHTEVLAGSVPVTLPRFAAG